MPAQHAGTSFSEPIDLIEDIPIASSMPSRKDPGRDGRTKVHTPASSRVAPYPASSVGRRRTAISASSPSARGHRTSEPSPSQSLKRQALSRQPREALSSGEGSPSEKRVRRFRPSCPQAFHEIYERATTQRFYVLERYRVGTPQCPEEIVELTGSTGSIYLVHITKQPKCTCPHAEKGNQCKHMVYVLAKVLNAPFELVYQLALLSTELQQIFANSPPISAPPEAKTEDKNRKPIDGDCPICFSELDATGGESVVWCRAACGQNMHRDCFGMWAKSKAGETTCPFCRSIWEGNKDLVDTKKIDRSRGLIEDGYINIRDQLPGVSRFRDESTYSSWSPYMRRHRWENEW